MFTLLFLCALCCVLARVAFPEDFEDYDPPIIRKPSVTGAGPTGNWYLVHESGPGSTTTHLSGHLTRAGAEREVARCKAHLPWASKGEWVIKPTSEYKSQP